MRKTETFEIEGYEKKVIVNELTIKQIISLMEKDVLGDASLDHLRSQFEETILPMCTNLKLDDLLEMAPSDVKHIWGKFREINEAFFEMARDAGLLNLVSGIKEAIIADFSKLAVSSSKQGTPTS